MSELGGRTVTAFQEAYTLQELCDLCPCVWTNDSCDTLLISIREAAVEPLFMWTGDTVSCTRTTQQGKHVTLRVILFIRSFIKTTYCAPNLFIRTDFKLDGIKQNIIYKLYNWTVCVEFGWFIPYRPKWDIISTIYEAKLKEALRRI